ncbi:MAG: MoaD/ThiS family protein [Lutibacter sp.]|nr:MoaD/ThiS family protein [Lutibacter sp.]
MKIQLLFFGIATDLVGENSVFIELKSAATISKLKKELLSKYSKLKNIEDFAIAVNEEYAENDLVLQENDVVAIIPPVSGG